MNFFVRNAEWVTVIGGVIALVGTILVNLKSKYESSINEQKQASLLEQSTQINNIMTGGDSWPLLRFTAIKRHGVAEYNVMNQGQYPLYLTQVTIEDSFEIQKITGIPMVMVSPDVDPALLGHFTKDVSLGEIMPRSIMALGAFPFSFKDGGVFKMTFTARNGRFVQRTFIHKTGNRWITAERVTDFAGHKVFFESIPTDFPRELVRW